MKAKFYQILSSITFKVYTQHQLLGTRHRRTTGGQGRRERRGVLFVVSGPLSVAKRINGIGLDDCGLRKAPMNLPLQKSLLPFDTMSQFAEPAIPDESA